MPSKDYPHPESLTRNELSFSNMLSFSRHSRESGNPGASGKPPAVRAPEGLDPIEKLPWTPAFAGVTITTGNHCIHFRPASEEAPSAVSKDARRSCDFVTESPSRSSLSRPP